MPLGRVTGAAAGSPLDGRGGSLCPSYLCGPASEALCRQYWAAGSDKTRLLARRPIQYRP